MTQAEKDAKIADLEAQLAEAKKAPVDAPILFPAMVYKDLNGNGKFEDPGETRTVYSEDELDKAIDDGWSDHPDKAVKVAAKAQSKSDAKDAKAEAAAEKKHYSDAKHK